MNAQVIAVLSLIAVASCTHEHHIGHTHDDHHKKHHHPTVLERLEEAGVPTPYHFQYAVDAGDGSHSREESSDAAGRVTGSYVIRLADGRSRTVSYTADEHGYHAKITTNEMGTESQSPADVQLESSAPTAKEASLAYKTVEHRHLDHHRNLGHHEHIKPVPSRLILGKY
ncbi:cuticle protein 10.9 [Galendromus occidentalis]|uniref:Cuticle protein 10.9 n=1 Tax=Galendromus occidentalis TaxID=34638 RepID=A0AAJ6VX37_9ACAR|nr:cuticle protein 10.9 [Galendromus occidentalis]